MPDEYLNPFGLFLGWERRLYRVIGFIPIPACILTIYSDTRYVEHAYDA